MEGDNAFACQNCWKLLNPDLVQRYKHEKEAKRRAHRAKKLGSAGSDAPPPPAANNDEEAQTTPTALRSPALSKDTPLPTMNSPLASTGSFPLLNKSTSTPSLSSGTGSSSHVESSLEGSATDNEDSGNLTDVSIASNPNHPFRRLTKANLALAIPKTKSDASSNFSFDSLNTAESGPAASLSTRNTGSTRFSMPADGRSHLHQHSSTATDPPTPLPRSARHILRRAHKRYLLSAPSPPVLVIHLKRFQHTSKSLFGGNFNSLKKRDDMVTFPLELDLTPFLAPKGKPPGRRTRKSEEVEEHVEVGGNRYSLYAVVVHAGTLKEGHFTTYVLSDRYEEKEKKGRAPGSVDTEKAEEEGEKKEEGVEEEEVEVKVEARRPRRWFFCSDEQVRACTVEEVLTCKAYILLVVFFFASSISRSTC